VRRLVHTALLALVLAGSGAAAAAEPEPSAEHAAQVARPGEQEEGHGGEHRGIDPKTLGLQFLNFAALLFILVKFGGPAVKKALLARHEQLKTDIEEAARLKQAAEERFRKHEQRLANLQREIDTMLASVKQEAEQEKVRILAAAEERARRIQEETKVALDQQVREAELRFRAEVAQAAVKVADELLRRSVTPSDEQRLAQSFVGELGAGRPAEGQKGPPRGKPHEEVVG
jgi:F-type H+-transporting ATPase subunit b